MNEFSHFNDQGRGKMVDVSEKEPTQRCASAVCRVLVSKETLCLIRSGGIKKGDVFTVAQIAGIMAARRTSDLIPLCHNITLDGADLNIRIEDDFIVIRSQISSFGRTGVEMEAMTAAAAAALTIYDMCKAIQRDIVITDLFLTSKSGGIHGPYQRSELSCN